MFSRPKSPDSIPAVLSAKPLKSEDMEDMREAEDDDSVTSLSLEDSLVFQNGDSFMGSLIACKLAKKRFFPAAAAGFATSFATAFASRATSLASEAKRSRNDWPKAETESLCCDCEREKTEEMEMARERVGVDVPDDRSIDVEGDIGRCSAESARGVELRLWSEASDATDSMGERPVGAKGGERRRERGREHEPDMNLGDMGGASAGAVS